MFPNNSVQNKAFTGTGYIAVPSKKAAEANLKSRNQSSVAAISALSKHIPSVVTTASIAQKPAPKIDPNTPSYSNIPWRKDKDPISFEKSYEKMMKNSLKAIVEHQKKEEVPGSYITVEELGKQIEELESGKAPSLKITYEHHDDIGDRSDMQDTHFYVEKDTSMLLGVFDGHGGGKVSDFARDYFRANFYKVLNICGNVHLTFEYLFHKIQQEIEKNENIRENGSTAVICFVDKINNLVYTATLADSEANLYREIGGQTKSIPLSCVRDWGCKKEVARAIKSGNPTAINEWPKIKDPKERYYNGLNLSRTLGDTSSRGPINRPGIIGKPKMTVGKFKEDDVLILACDGLKDFVKEETIIKEVAANKSKKDVNLAKHLVEIAVKHGDDNCTVLAVKFTKRI